MKVRVWVTQFSAEMFGNVTSARVVDGGWSITHRNGAGELVGKTYGVGEWTAITFDLQAPAEPSLYPSDAGAIE